MARNLSTDLQDALKAETTTLARILRIERTDGNTVRLTDAVDSLKMGDEVFYATVGMTISAVYQSSINQSGQSTQFTTVFHSAGITKEDLVAGLYEQAAVTISLIDYTNLLAGEMILFKGRMGRYKFSDRGLVTIETVPTTAASIMLANEKYGDTCRNILGDAGCTVNLNSFGVNFAITTITANALTFSVDSAANQDDGYFTLGHILWVTGDNADTNSDVRVSTNDATQISLFYRPAVSFPIVGDTGILYPGCDLKWKTCKLKFNNLNRFRGEPLRPSWVLAKGLPNAGGGGNSPTFTPGEMRASIRYGGTGGTPGPRLIGS